MSKNAQNSISGFYQFCKKKTPENVAVNFLQFIMIKNLQIHLRLDQLKIIGVSSKCKSLKEIVRLKTRDHLIWRIKVKHKEINHDIVIKMVDNLKGQVHVANQSLMKF